MNTAGFIGCFSLAGVPTLEIAPVDVLVHQFKTMYNIGKSTSPPLAIAVTICNLYSAYRSKGETDIEQGIISPFRLYLAAAILIPCIIPYTLLYMEPTVNEKLISLGAKVEKGSNANDLGVSHDEVRAMLMRWKTMNFVRAGIVGIGAILTATATLS